MVYFFHHYELPAILQQARIQHLLAHGAGARNQTSSATASQNAATQNESINATPTGSRTASQEGNGEVIQNGQIPSQAQNNAERNDGAVLSENDFTEIQRQSNNTEGQRVLGDLELSAILHDTLNQTLDVEIDEAMQNDQDSEDEFLTDLIDFDFNHSELENNSHQHADCDLNNSTQSPAETDSIGAVGPCNSNSSVEVSVCDSKQAISELSAENIKIENVSAIASNSSNSAADSDSVRYRGHKEHTSDTSG